MSVDYYALLGVPKFCSSQDEIRRAYLAQARFFHPDAGNVTPEIAHQKMQELNAIYDTLRDPDAKRLYDATRIHAATSSCSWRILLRRLLERLCLWPCCILESSRRPGEQHASRAGSHHAHRSDAERHGSVLHTTDDAQQKQKTKRRQHTANPPSCPHILPAAVPCSPRSFAQHNDFLLHLPSSSLYRNGSGSLPLSSVHAPGRSSSASGTSAAASFRLSAKYILST